MATLSLRGFPVQSVRGTECRGIQSRTTGPALRCSQAGSRSDMVPSRAPHETKTEMRGSEVRAVPHELTPFWGGDTAPYNRRVHKYKLAGWASTRYRISATCAHDVVAGGNRPDLKCKHEQGSTGSVCTAGSENGVGEMLRPRAT